MSVVWKLGSAIKLNSKNCTNGFNDSLITL